MNTLDKDNEWWLQQTGEYVLGTLDGQDRAVIDAVIKHDEAIRQMVIEWENTLQPIANSQPSTQPPSHVWERVARRINTVDAEHYGDSAHHDLYDGSQTSSAEITSAESDNSTAVQMHKLAHWRVLAVMSVAASLLMGAIILNGIFNPISNNVFDQLTIIENEQQAALWHVSTSTDRALVSVTALSDIPVNDNESLQLWMALPDNSVVSMGLLPTENNVTELLSPAVDLSQGIAYAVSLEPKGGSPKAVPTGPVLYQGSVRTLRTDEL